MTSSPQQAIVIKSSADGGSGSQTLRSNRARRRSIKRKGPSTVTWLILLFLATSAITFGAMWWFSPVENMATGESQTKGQLLIKAVENVIAPKKSLEVSFAGKKSIELLLVGLDHVPPTPGDPGIIRRADSILVASIGLETKQVRIVSVPRDGWIEHWQDGHHYGYEKAGHTYALGQQTNLKDPGAGIQRTLESIEHLLDIELDYYVIVEFEGLVKIIDELGGLDLDIQKDMKYTDKAGGLFIDLKKGSQHLNGEQVVQYARFRHDALGDIGRMKRQQEVLKMALAKITDTRSPAKLNSLVSLAENTVRTSLAIDQLIALSQHAEEFPEAGIKTLTLDSYWNREPGKEIKLPGVPEGRFVDAQAIFKRDTDKAREFLSDLEPPPVPQQTDEGEGGELEPSPGK